MLAILKTLIVSDWTTEELNAAFEVSGYEEDVKFAKFSKFENGKYYFYCVSEDKVDGGYLVYKTVVELTENGLCAEYTGNENVTNVEQLPQAIELAKKQAAV